jgi:hypothetical protein
VLVHVLPSILWALIPFRDFEIPCIEYLANNEAYTTCNGVKRREKNEGNNERISINRMRENDTIQVIYFVSHN